MAGPTAKGWGRRHRRFAVGTESWSGSSASQMYPSVIGSATYGLGTPTRNAVYCELSRRGTLEFRWGGKPGRRMPSADGSYFGK